jgi:large subunit ribosomal protein L13
MKTYSVKAGEIKRQWQIIDASDKILGKLAVEVAQHLMGKNKSMFSRHLDTGDYVMVINAARVKVTGKKLLQKEYSRHSGYAGGYKSVTLEELLKTQPEKVIQHAVRGMLPQNKLGDAMIKKLKVYAGVASPNQSAEQQAEA